MKNNKRKGYVLALVLVIGLVMAATAGSTITIIFRYMIHAKESIPEAMEYQIEEVYTDARI